MKSHQHPLILRIILCTVLLSIAAPNLLAEWIFSTCRSVGGDEAITCRGDSEAPTVCTGVCYRHIALPQDVVCNRCYTSPKLTSCTHVAIYFVNANAETGTCKIPQAGGQCGCFWNTPPTYAVVAIPCDC